MTVRAFLPRLAFVAALLAAPAALAQEVTAGRDTGAPPDAQASGLAIAPARAGGAPLRPPPAQPAAATDAKKPSRCAPLPDHQPHGEVWGAVGTNGYREGGGVVTQPLGDCASVTLSIDETRFDARHRH